MRERDKFDVPVEEWRHVGKLKGLGRRKPKRTDVYELAINSVDGLHLRKASGFSRKHVRGYHAYECMNVDCFYDFRLRRSKDPEVLKRGRMLSCPACGSLYVEWLSYGIDPRGIFLRTEEEEGQIPWGSFKVLGKAARP